MYGKIILASYAQNLTLDWNKNWIANFFHYQSLQLVFPWRIIISWSLIKCTCDKWWVISFILFANSCIISSGQWTEWPTKIDRLMRGMRAFNFYHSFHWLLSTIRKPYSVFANYNRVITILSFIHYDNFYDIR